MMASRRADKQYLNVPCIVEAAFLVTIIFLILFAVPAPKARADHCGVGFTSSGSFFDDFEEVEYSAEGYLILHLKLKPSVNDGRGWTLTRGILADNCQNGSTQLNQIHQISLTPGIEYFSIRFTSPTHFDFWNDELNVMETCDNCSQDFLSFPDFYEFFASGSTSGGSSSSFRTSSNRIYLHASDPPFREDTLPLLEGCSGKGARGVLYDEYESVEYVNGFLQYHFRFRTPFNLNTGGKTRMFFGGNDCTETLVEFTPELLARLPGYIRYYSLRFSSKIHYDIWNDDTNEKVECAGCSNDIPTMLRNGDPVSLVQFFLFSGSGSVNRFLSSTFPVLESDYRGQHVSSRVLQYEPILYLHPEEHYQPMNVEAFVETSSLWDDNGLLPDTLIKAESTTDPVTLSDISAGTESENWYLQYSGGSITPKTFSTITAFLKYKLATTTGKAIPTYYSYEMEDSFVDDDGNLQEYIVLQYWYFYAFNDWLEHGGRNNHEGDWETVMVFLDKSTEEPKYVAYSAHLNDGNPALNPFQFDSVRRDWVNEVEKEGDQVKSFVALGSHANYPNNETHTVPGESTDFLDLTSVEGERLFFDSWINKNFVSSTTPDWISGYEGKWGTDGVQPGVDGPQGPKFISPTFGDGVDRFNHPIEWAGIDKIAEKTITDFTDELAFNNETTLMSFEEALAPGTVVSVNQHDEFISFGDGIDEINLLPHFWDLESSLGDNLPTTTVTFTYDSEETQNFGIIEQDLSIFLYNEESTTWKEINSLLDTETSTISFTIDHFSRYAIGAREYESITEQVNIKRHWSRYDPKQGTREVYLDISGENLPDTLRVLIINISTDGTFLINNTGTTTDSVPFVDIQTENNTSATAQLIFSIPPKKILTSESGEVTHVPDSLKFDFEVEVQQEL